ncbi:hypothetical protein LO762_06860 [Actinocorallia sp. API 0066]|uniref:hypothetical protein n=1 Tax=Actinocorallia sp. API 0066 TaxID=2896846 RepID=UPI001E282789|nr:hypothetical protein [Actinocorallia sp. API 0066]MCD0448910.1 hypothetical protein [Actinocorallia sp. API 0066]
MSLTIDTALKEVQAIEGFLGASLVDYESGMPLGIVSSDPEFDLDVAAAVTTDIVRAQVKAFRALEVEDAIEDILISLTNQYHIIRVVDREADRLFLYVALDRERANLGLARITLRKIERELAV